MARYREVDELTYPHKLPPSLKEMVAVKLYNFRQEHDAARGEVDAKWHNHNIGTKQVPLDDLSPNDRALVGEYVRAQKKYYKLEKEFREKFSHTIGSDSVQAVAVRMSEEEVQAVRKQVNEEYTALSTAYNERVKQLVEVARKMVEARIAAVKVKVPQNLLDEFNSIK